MEGEDVEEIDDSEEQQDENVEVETSSTVSLKKLLSQPVENPPDQTVFDEIVETGKKTGTSNKRKTTTAQKSTAEKRRSGTQVIK